MANGFMGGMGQPGERETTRHGMETDVKVPVQELQQCIFWDEVRVTIVMLMIPILATIFREWTFPMIGAALFVVATYSLLQNAQTANEFMWTLAGLILGAGVTFGIMMLLRKGIETRLNDGWLALWRWPPQVGVFLFKIAFLALPFFIPFFRHIPLLIERFRIAIADPSWPSPRTARDVEGMQSPYHYADVPEVKPAIYPITVGNRKNSHGKPTAQKRRDLFAPASNAEGLARYAQAVLAESATISEKGARKNSKSPKRGATDYGYTQDEYYELKDIMQELGLIEPSGNGHKLTVDGYSAFVEVVIATLGENALPHPDNVLET